MTDPREDDKNRFYYTMEGDRIVKVDSFTGDVVQKELRKDDGFIAGRDPHPDYHLPTARKYKFTQMFGDIICTHLLKGKSFAAISRMPGMPSYNTIAKWREMYPEFDKDVKTALKHRASHFRDRIADDLEKIKELPKEKVPAAKLHIDTAKWLAEKDDPDTYGTRTKISGDSDNPVVIQVNTGINRDNKIDLPNKIQPQEGDIDVNKD